MKIDDITTEPGGYAVTVEVENAYTDGSSRFDIVHMSFSDVDGREEVEVLAAIKERWSGGVRRLKGRELDTAPDHPPRTKGFYEDAIQAFGIAAVEEWMAASPATVRAIDGHNWRLARHGVREGYVRNIITEQQRDAILQLMTSHGFPEE